MDQTCFLNVDQLKKTPPFDEPYVLWLDQWPAHKDCVFRNFGHKFIMYVV